MTRTKECLELMHTDMYGSFSVHAWGGYGYFITFNDDYSKFGYVHRKFDALTHSLYSKQDRITY